MQIPLETQRNHSACSHCTLSKCSRYLAGVKGQEALLGHRALMCAHKMTEGVMCRPVQSLSKKQKQAEWDHRLHTILNHSTHTENPCIVELSTPLSKWLGSKSISANASGIPF